MDIDTSDDHHADNNNNSNDESAGIGIHSPSTSSHSLLTRLPLVHSVLRTYEQAKASSHIVKFSAEMMESSVRTISQPVINRLPVSVNQLDEFACRQLDRASEKLAVRLGSSSPTFHLSSAPIDSSSPGAGPSGEMESENPSAAGSLGEMEIESPSAAGSSGEMEIENPSAAGPSGEMKIEDPSAAGPSGETKIENPSASPRPGSSTLQLQIPPEALELFRQQLLILVQPSFGDALLRKRLSVIFEIVNMALQEDPQRSKRLIDVKSFLANVQREGEEEFFELLRKIAEKDSWEELLENDIFSKQVEIETTEIYEQDHGIFSNAAEYAWKTEFKGSAADVLLTTISNYLRKERGDIYARHATIVNSSGTGKSRMVDQMAREIITVPMCLRAKGSTGFPPPDENLRDWLCTTTSRILAQNKVGAFVYSLLTILRKHLIDIEKSKPMDKAFEKSEISVIKRQQSLAHAFRKRMSEGQSFKTSNRYRTFFYDTVIKEADKYIELLATEGHHDSQEQAPKLKSPRLLEWNDMVLHAGLDLCKFIDPLGLLDSHEESRRPLVVLAFDEAHTLTDILNHGSWTVFFELRRTLKRLVGLPIFSLFLSTAGKLSPEIREDPSSRISHLELRPLDPITEISFDDIAYPMEDEVRLEQVVQVGWMSHLGRPLFGSYYDTLLRDKETVLKFAKTKLLNGPFVLDSKNASGILACLSVRFSLEFNADVISGRVARTQVERHMRLCISATTGFERLVTLAGSEPLLAEAAYELMRSTLTNPVRLLALHSDLNCIDRGRRGELVAALIIMQARDAALSGARCVSVCKFMQVLLPDPAYEDLSNSTPIFWLEGEDQRSFSETFEHHSMWFNHVIKIEDSDMIHVESLWRFITRGAMVMCADGQRGVDIVLPVVCDMRKPLSSENVTAILIQVKNDKSYKLKINKTLFDRMQPFELGLFSEGQSKPVIRVVFALASNEDGILFPPKPERKPKHAHNFTAFDMWCAGLSSNTFKQTGDQDLDAYRLLLERSLQPHDAFNLQGTDDPYLDSATRRARGLQRRRMAALTMSES